MGDADMSSQPVSPSSENGTPNVNGDDFPAKEEVEVNGTGDGDQHDLYELANDSATTTQDVPYSRPVSTDNNLTADETSRAATDDVEGENSGNGRSPRIPEIQIRSGTTDNAIVNAGSSFNAATNGTTTTTTTSNTTATKKPDKACPVDATLWMSEVLEAWDQAFLTAAFEHFGYKPINVKIINEKNRASPYAFVEFESAQTAKAAILKVNGRSIPNDPARHKFQLSFANLPNQIINEYCLSVSNLSSSITEADLFKLFGKKYGSCRGAKVHTHADGTSKGFGFVKFSDETDQQLALVEMHKYPLKGKEILLRLAGTKQRGPKNLIKQQQQQQQAQQQQQQALYGVGGVFSSGLYPMQGLIPQNPYAAFPPNPMQFGVPSTSPYSSGRYRSPERSMPYDRDRRSRRSRSRDRGNGSRRSPDRGHIRSRERVERERPRRRMKTLDELVQETKDPMLYKPLYYPPYSQDAEFISIDEHNKTYMDISESVFQAQESAKWSDFVVSSTWKREDLKKKLYSELLIDA